MRTATDFVPHASTGSTTSIDIAATPHAVWRALHNIRFRDLPLTAVLLGVRSLPALLRRRGAQPASCHDLAARTVLGTMTSRRFVVLHCDPDRLLTLGIVGQFWRLGGGDETPVHDRAAFASFSAPGYVTSAIDFVIEPHAGGSRLSTRTRTRGTDAVADRHFRRYWRVVGPGSKLIRVELLRAVRSRAPALDGRD